MAAPNIVTSYKSTFQHLKTLNIVLSPVAVAQQTTAEQTFTVTGLLPADSLQPGDQILQITKPTAQAGLGIVGWRVSAADTLAITFINAPAGGNITPTALETYQIVVFRPNAPTTTALGTAI
jgi:hypothetical protein